MRRSSLRKSTENLIYFARKMEVYRRRKGDRIAEMENLKRFSLEKIKLYDKVIHEKYGEGFVGAINKPNQSFSMLFDIGYDTIWMTVTYNHGWFLERAGIQSIGDFSLKAEDTIGSFDWEKVKKFMIVHHKMYGYGVVVESGLLSICGFFAQINFEHGPLARFSGEEYREFTKIGPWGEEDLK